MLAAADADSHCYDLNISYNSIFPATNLRHTILVDSNGLHDTITTLHDPKEYLLWKTASRMRDSFASGVLEAIGWISGTDIVADGLTKHNAVLRSELIQVMAEILCSQKLDDDGAL